MFCPVCHVLVSCSPFAGLHRPVLCGVVCWLYTYNPVQVPTCHGAFVRINIYLSCSLSCCSRCVLSRRFWRSSPRRQRYATEKCDFSLKKKQTTKTSSQFHPLLKCMTPCWVSLHVWCGVCLSWKEATRRWMAQTFNVATDELHCDIHDHFHLTLLFTETGAWF